MVEAGNRPQPADVDNDVTVNASSSDAHGGGTLLAESVLDRRYRLIGVLSSRGPVTLWRGDDTVLTRPVAVRVVEHIDDDPARREAAQSLLQAAVSSGRLVHPGAASTYDATVTNTENGQVSYVITEWVDGRTLRQLVEDQPLRPDQASAVVLGAARVIAAAHERGLRHGGLRPGDVIVSGHGTVKVIDLEVGAVLAGIDGTAPADAPADADAAAADVCALGGLLYAALTGCWPLAGDTGLPAAPYGTYGRLQSPRQLNHAVPRDLDAITMAALSGEEAGTEPITTAAELIAELEAVTPVEALHATGLMTFGDEPSDTEAMAGYDGYGPDTSNLPSTAGFAAPDQDDYDRYGYDDYDNGYQDGGRYRDEYRGETQVDRGRGGGYRPSYQDEGYPPAQRGYQAAGPGGTGPRPGSRAAAHGRSGRTSRRPLIVIIALAVVVVVVAVVLGLNLGSNGGGGGANNSPTASATVTAGVPITPVNVVSFDPPPGDGSENNGQVARAYDGNPATQWETEGYLPPYTFGNPAKKGVGLLFDLGQSHDVSQVVVTLGTLAPDSFEIRAGDSFDANAQNLGLYQVVGQQQNASGTVTVNVSPRGAHRYWVVWLTNIPQGADSKFKGSIAEIKFLS
ncbi:protein kinase family protein [Pseudofrankia sp. DC12]|uniref:protein kinase family protein n=1 Tax=Pseudofrankia sp. DC12 TaxID=683315 RepID=UPI0005F89417|nr:protein kinase family protein [Pseudofrankia sp. DC12]